MFIDCILEPENAAKNVAWIGYPMPCDGRQARRSRSWSRTSRRSTSPSTSSPTAVEYRLDNPEARQLWTETFTEVKAA